ncbi:MAG TPA: sensor domain-containing diguanylate cyclase [Pyrinomonadaceae bacterium]|nr:sensor domain-containing diguanylate cyclase [Pyrinomonadaceae bacterium]
MDTLYNSLLAQHSRQLTPVRCAPSTIAQLHRYFEEVVTENDLASLVVEALPPTLERPRREISRVRQVAATARDFFLFACADDPLARVVLTASRGHNPPVVVSLVDHCRAHERFLVIADKCFSALLVSVPEDESAAVDRAVWTFEPDVVHSALEYLKARVTAEQPLHAAAFAKAVQLSMPEATSLELALSVTTKLARLLQQQAEREIVVNRIAAAIRNSVELETILQTAANEVGRTLNARTCGVSVAGNLLDAQMTKCYFRPGVSVNEPTVQSLLAQIENTNRELERTPKLIAVDGDTAPRNGIACVTVPLTYKGSFIGALRAESDDSSRVWEDNELLLLQTVADQLSVAVKQAHLSTEIQQQALTDSLTGCYNRRAFELQLERDLHLATRMRQPISVIMLDLDYFKSANDSAGHATGDLALRTLSETLRRELRAVDTTARLGGDEFAIILPQAALEGAKIVAERLRRIIKETEIPGCGSLTASFGVASFPNHASSRDTLVLAADQALYNSKQSGRDCVSVAIDDGFEPTVDGPDLRNRQNLFQESLSGR